MKIYFSITVLQSSGSDSFASYANAHFVYGLHKKYKEDFFKIPSRSSSSLCDSAKSEVLKALAKKMEGE